MGEPIGWLDDEIVYFGYTGEYLRRIRELEADLAEKNRYITFLENELAKKE